MVDDEGNLVNNYTYDAWGNVLSETETVQNPIKYAGEYYDAELDMYYLRARYYQPQTGRFTSLDILEGDVTSSLDLNRYVYCRNNPVKYTDPSGEEVITITVIGGATFVCLIKAVVISAAAIAVIGVAMKAIDNVRRNYNKPIYYKAWLANGNVVIGDEMEIAEALNWVEKGNSVFTPEESAAKNLAIVASNGKTPIKHLPHGGRGYRSHYHLYNHKDGVHIWY